MRHLFCLLLAFTLAFPSIAQLRMNEVCYDPSNVGLAGDANNDGTYDQVQDEFIEFVNEGNSPLDVSKYKIYDKVIASGVRTLRHTMANGLRVPARGALVVFGGGSAVGTFGGAVVTIDVGTAGLSLANSGEMVILTDSSGNGLDSMNTDELSDNPNESYTRNPDFTGMFVQHGSLPSARLFSPGLKVDGNPFDGTVSTQALEKNTELVVYPNPSSGKVFLNGLHAGNNSIRIVNTSSQEVFYMHKGSGELDLSHLPNGMYFLNVHDKEGVRKTRFILAR